MDLKWLCMCATAAEFLYGYFPVGVLRKMYQKKNGCKASFEELIDAMQKLQEEGMVLLDYEEGLLDDTEDQGPGFFCPLECEDTALESTLRKADKEGNVFASIHLDDDERQELLEEQPADLDFYVPSQKEITELYENGFIRSKQMVELEQLIAEQGGDPALLKQVWGQICTDKFDHMEATEAILNLITNNPAKKSSEKKANFSSVDEINGVMPYISNFFNNVNQRARKGWKPDDLFKKMHPHGFTEMPTIVPGSMQAAKAMMAAKAQFKAMGIDINIDMSTIGTEVTVGPHGERRVVKVGPNDPCPCGSGKKYKRCHGR